MTNQEKVELMHLVRQGYSFKEIRTIVDCSDSTIRLYIKALKPKDPVEGK